MKICSPENRKKIRAAEIERITKLMLDGKIDQAKKELKEIKKFEDTLDQLCNQRKDPKKR